MKSNRRQFVRNSTLAVLAGTLLSRDLFAELLKKDILGLQLYTVRDDMTRDPLGTLIKVRDIGFRYVEHANYIQRKFYGYDPLVFKKILSDTGLEMPSGHVVLGPKAWDYSKNDFTDDWKNTVEDAVTVGQKFLISPWLDESLRKDYKGLLAFLDILNKSGELCLKHGLHFGYHNHDFEFNTYINHRRLYDIILDHTNPKLVVQEMDIGNMYGTGGRALDILKQYPGRFEMMHVKDEIKTSKGELETPYVSTILGKGLLPVREIVDFARSSGGTSYFIIEQESYQDMSPLQCSREDYEVMKKWGF